MGKKKKKRIEFSSPIPQGLSKVDSEAEKEAKQPLSDSCPTASWIVGERWQLCWELLGMFST